VVEAGKKSANGGDTVQRHAQGVGPKGRKNQCPIPIGRHLPTRGDGSTGMVSGGDYLADHPDQAGMEYVVRLGPHRVIAINAQARGDQIVCAKGEEVDALSPYSHQGCNGGNFDHDSERDFPTEVQTFQDEFVAGLLDGSDHEVKEFRPRDQRNEQSNRPVRCSSEDGTNLIFEQPLQDRSFEDQSPVERLRR
jgi:hypothetical protein